MAIWDTLLPVADIAGTFWGTLANCASPTNTGIPKWQALSDNNNDTWAQSGDPTSLLVVSCGIHNVPAGHERHAARVRGRYLAFGVNGTQRISGQSVNPVTGGTFWFVNLDSVISPPVCSVLDKTSAFVSAGVTPATEPLEYRIGVRHVSGAICRIAEAVVTIDSRAYPTFTPDVLDGAGVSRDGGVITDNNQPRFVFDAQNLDGLPARSWRAAIYAQPTTVAPGFTPFTTTPIQLLDNVGPASQVTFDPVPNGQYVIFGEISTTIRTTDPFLSNIESVDFEVDFPPPDPPANLTATVTDFPPSIEVCWEDPESGIPWDEPTQVVAELFRIDCNGTARIATIGDGLTACWVDRFFGLNPEPGCEPDTPCNIQYQVRYWGYSNGILVTTDFTST